MRTITRATLALTGAAALTLFAVVPANADNDVAVTVVGGTLVIATTEAPVDLTDAAPGAASTGSLVGVSVNDTRAGVVGWSVGVTATPFEGATAAATTSMESAAITYTAGTITVTGTSNAATAPVGPVVLTATPLSVAAADTVSGNNTAAWAAGLAIAVPASALGGDYSSTVTHSSI